MLAALFTFALFLPPSIPVQEGTAEEVEVLDELPPGWVQGPGEGRLGDRAVVQVPDGFVFGDATGAQRWLEANENPTSGRELGVLMTIGLDTEPDKSWAVVFEFDESGYVKDEDRADLDADALMESMREGNEYGNELRKERGWETLDLIGWQREPFYDERTKNLTWATLLSAERGGKSVNWSVRVLGREGVMNIDLVLSPSGLDGALPQFEKIIDSFEYVDGQRYAQFTSGDKIAQYGLAALVLGGGAAVAAKTGLFAKLAKFLLPALIAVGAFGKKIWGWFTGRSRTDESRDAELR